MKHPKLQVMTLQKYYVAPGRRVLYEIPSWVIIHSTVSNSHHWVAHYCSNYANTSHLWRHSSWTQFKQYGIVCYWCKTKIPDDIQTLYTLVST